jgi:hypothetical protein
MNDTDTADDLVAVLTAAVAEVDQMASHDAALA